MHRLRQSLLRRKTALALRKFELDPDVERQVTEWELLRVVRPEVWAVLEADTIESKEGSTLVKQPDGSILSTGALPATDTYTITARSPLRRITSVKLEVLTVDDHPYKGPGRQDNGNFHLSEFRMEAGGKPVPLNFPSADFNQNGWTIAHALDGKPETAWGIYPEVGKPHTATFQLKQPIYLAEGGS